MRQAADGEAVRVTADAPAVVGPRAGVGRGRDIARAANLATRSKRCLTCTRALAPGVERYCDDACLLKHGLTKRSPGRTAAHRRRRRGR